MITLGCRSLACEYSTASRVVQRRRPGCAWPPVNATDVAAALAVQRAIATHSWPEGIEVRVRIGLHTTALRKRVQSCIFIILFSTLLVCIRHPGSSTPVPQPRALAA